MTPTLGRVVWFHDFDSVKEARVTRPAIILAVDVDADATGDSGMTVDLGIFSEVGYGYIAKVQEGRAVGQWSWPILNREVVDFHG